MASASRIGRVPAAVLLAALILLPAACRSRAPDAGPDVSVFAAASLADVLQVLADSFETAYPRYDVSLNLAATPILARQIEQGAPADVFFSASVDWMRHVREEGRIQDPVLYPVGNRLVVAVPAGSDSLRRLEDLAGVERLALAEPSSVPAGIYARQALTCLGLWPQVQPHVIPVLDVRTALLTVSHRAADAAVVYASDLLADPGVRQAAVIPDTCQPRIRYAAAVTSVARQREGALAFLRYVTAPERQPVWERYGFRFLVATDPAAP